jgi:multidrug resistance efflux pump
VWRPFFSVFSRLADTGQSGPPQGSPTPGPVFAKAETQAVGLFQNRALGVPGMKHQHHFGGANVIALREAARIGAFIGDLDRRAQLLDHDIAAEEERAQAFNPFDAAYPFLARTLAARRDNLKVTVAALEKRRASLQELADKVR